MASSPKQATLSIGVSIRPTAVEGVLLTLNRSTNLYEIAQSTLYPLPSTTFNATGDILTDPEELSAALANVLKTLNASKTKEIHLSIPATLLRLVDMPVMDESELYVSLSSEAERYKTFDNTDAAVDFHILGQVGPQSQRLVFGAVRMDTLQGYLRAFQAARLRPKTIDFEPLNLYRSMAGTGVLDSLVQQIGTEQPWGSIFVEPDRLRLAIWQANTLLEFREINIDTRNFSNAGPSSFHVEELYQELMRTAKDRYPVIWLSHHLPEGLRKPLAERMGVPIKACFIPPQFPTDRPDVDLAALGAAFRAMVSFPFNLDLTRLKIMPGKTAQAATTVSARATGNTRAAGGAGTSSGGSGWLVPALVLSILLMGGLWLALFLGNSYLGGQVQELTRKRDNTLVSMTSLSQKLKRLQDQYAVQVWLADMAKTARIRNTVCVRLTEDLRFKTPPKLWLQSIEMSSSAIRFQGQSLSHQSVIDFAKSFDGVSYASGILIEAINEGFLNSSPVFEFKVKGMFRADPNLLEVSAVTDPLTESGDGGSN